MVMAAPVFLRKAFLLRRGTENLGPFAVLEDDLIPAGENLERLADLLQTVERYGPALVEDFEVRRVHEIRHRNPVDREAQGLDRVRALVGINDLRIRTRAHQVDRR